jgi:hypothetical protein
MGWCGRKERRQLAWAVIWNHDSGSRTVLMNPKDGAREWFIGPVLTWLHSQDDRIAGVTQTGSGGDLLLAGMTTYVGVRPGMHLWLGMDWDTAHSAGALFMPVRRHISFGITQQFRMHFFK